VFWLAVGGKRRQKVRLGPVVTQAMEIGIGALPIVTVLTGTTSRLKRVRLEGLTIAEARARLGA
jgi:hypothetical protein